MSMYSKQFALGSRGQYVLYFLLIWSYVTRSTKLFNDWFFHHVNCAWDDRNAKDRLLLSKRKHLIILICETLNSWLYVKFFGGNFIWNLTLRHKLNSEIWQCILCNKLVKPAKIHRFSCGRGKIVTGWNFQFSSVGYFIFDDNFSYTFS